MNLFKKKFIRVPHLSFFESIKESGRNPFIDWLWILIISLIIIVVLIFFSMNLYQSVLLGNIQSTSVENNTVVATFDQKDLKLIIDKLNLKENIQNQAKRGYVGSSNPAI